MYRKLFQEVGLQQQMQDAQFNLPKDNQYITPEDSGTFLIYYGNQIVEYGNISEKRIEVMSVNATVRFSDITEHVDREGGGYDQYFISGSDCYRKGITSSKNVENYHENTFKSKREESSGNILEVQYNILKTNKDGILSESFTKFYVVGGGSNELFYNTDIKTNQVEYYDLKNAQKATFTIYKDGKISNFQASELGEEEVKRIRAEAVSLRRDVIESYQATEVYKNLNNQGKKTFYEKNNPLPEKDDGKGFLDMDRLRQQVEEMTKGYKLNINNQASYALVEGAPDKQKC